MDIACGEQPGPPCACLCGGMGRGAGHVSRQLSWRAVHASSSRTRAWTRRPALIPSTRGLGDKRTPVTGIGAGTGAGAGTRTSNQYQFCDAVVGCGGTSVQLGCSRPRRLRVGHECRHARCGPGGGSHLGLTVSAVLRMCGGRGSSRRRPRSCEVRAELSRVSVSFCSSFSLFPSHLAHITRKTYAELPES